MQKKKGISLIVLIIVIIVVVVIGTVIVVIIRNSNRNNDVTEGNDGIKDFVDNVANMGEESSKVDLGDYIIPEESNFTWEDIDSGVRITGYTGNITAVEIPSMLSGKSVLEIGTSAFSQVAITSIKLPNTVKKINDKAFYYHTTLVEVVFGHNVEIIGEQAFEGCTALKKITLNEGIKEISKQAFGFTSSLTHVNFPSTLEIIGTGAFCLSGLEKIEIPGNVKTIKQSSFATCSSLKEVVVQEGTTKLEYDAFGGNSLLVRVELPMSVTEIESRVFSQSDNVVVYVQSGSVAELYVKENNINYVIK